MFCFSNQYVTFPNTDYIRTFYFGTVSKLHKGSSEALPDIYPAAATGKRPMRYSPPPPFRSITKAEQRLRISPIMITFANCSRTVDGRRKPDSVTVRAKGHTHDNDISK